MGKEQELLQAVKSADLQTTHKLLSKLKTSRSSKYPPAQPKAPPLAPPPSSPNSIAGRNIKALLSCFQVGGATSLSWLESRQWPVGAAASLGVLMPSSSAPKGRDASALR